MQIVSVVAAILYLAEFAARVSIFGWKRRPRDHGIRFAFSKRALIVLGAAVPIASFFVSRPISVGLVIAVFLAVLGNEARTWWQDRQVRQTRPAGADPTFEVWTDSEQIAPSPGPRHR